MTLAQKEQTMDDFENTPPLFGDLDGLIEFFNERKKEQEEQEQKKKETAPLPSSLDKMPSHPPKNQTDSPLGAYHLRQYIKKSEEGQKRTALGHLAASAYHGSIRGQWTLRFNITLVKNHLDPDTMEHWDTLSLDSTFFWLGCCYLTGIGRSQSDRFAMRVFEKMYQQEHLQGGFAFAMCHFEGIGVEQDEKKGALLLQTLVEQENQLAQCELALCYLQGRGVEQSYEKMFQTLEKDFFTPSSPLRSFLLSLCYTYGIGTEKNLLLGTYHHNLSGELDIEHMGKPVRHALLLMLDTL